MSSEKHSDVRISFKGPVSRRAVLQGGLAGAAGLAIGGPLSAASMLTKPRPAATAKAVIQIWMWGGPPHLDTFDPKPDAGEDYSGPLKNPIETNVSGIRISELLPKMALQADKYSILRSMTHGNNGHETASYMVQTGRRPGGAITYPCVGAVVSRFKGYDAGYEGLIPPYVVLTQPQGRFSESGFMGNNYKPFATGGNPAAQRFAVEGIVSEGITEERQRSRRALMHNLNSLGGLMPNDPRLGLLNDCEEQAYELILGDAGKVFDLSTADTDLRDRYGRNTFGQSCLMARRLVETGVKYITINFKGWDTHKEHFQIMRRQLPQLDSGLSTLLEDLDQHGLLDSTIVWWGGEFGRGPKVQWEAPWNGGRSHFGRCFSSVIAGGGFKGGTVVGESNATGEEVKDRPVYPWDLIGSMYEKLGIEPTAELPHPQGLKVTALPSEEEESERGGLLREIM
jgi:hypothetical protein